MWQKLIILTRNLKRLILMHNTYSEKTCQSSSVNDATVFRRCKKGNKILIISICISWTMKLSYVIWPWKWAVFSLQTEELINTQRIMIGPIDYSSIHINKETMSSCKIGILSLVEEVCPAVACQELSLRKLFGIWKASRFKGYNSLITCHDCRAVTGFDFHVSSVWNWRTAAEPV